MAFEFGFAEDNQKAIRGVFERQIQAMNTHNVDLYMSTIDPQMPAFNQTKKAMAALMKASKAKYRLDDVRVISIERQTATVIMAISIKGAPGSSTGTCKIATINTVSKDKGRWFTTATREIKREYTK